MKATDIILHSLDTATNWGMGMLNDLQDAPFAQPTSNGGNHAIWILGHITYSESSLLDGFILGKPNRFGHWEHLFAAGTTPTTDASKYPAFEELVKEFNTMRAATLDYLNTLSDDDLDKPSYGPEEFGPLFGTVGACCSAMSGHIGFHNGQLADIRRALGRPPLMM